MVNRTRPVPDADQSATWQLLEIGREVRIARLAAGMRLLDVARQVRTSASQMSRIERGRVPSVSYRLLAKSAAVVGLRLSVKAFPGRRRLLDKPQLDLLNRLRSRAHPSWRWETEVPMPIPGDLRAADARATRPGCVVVAELWSRLSDFQAQSRAASVKQRDLGADRLLLVLWGTSANRRALREGGEAVRASFPLGTRQVLAAMSAGQDPGANGIVLL